MPIPPPPDPSTLLDAPPAADAVTAYDMLHAKRYLRLIDAHKEGACWAEAASIVLGLDCDGDRDHAKRVHAAHLDRALWMTREGWKDLLAAARHTKPAP